MAGIRLQGIEKKYRVEGREIQVLKGINLEIPEERITVILGKSGCGKTTLLRIVGDLEPADAGEVLFHTAQKTAYVFQEARLMPWLSVWENVAFALKNKACDKKFIQNIIDTVGLSGFEAAYPDQLSGGMQQRVAIARALAYQPSFIMMDEPFAALDHFTRNQMQSELLKMQKECDASILFVTHSIDEALLLGHKVVIIENGQIKAEFNIPKKNEDRDILSIEFIEWKKKLTEQIGEQHEKKNS